jgi:hypothetical protein
MKLGAAIKIGIAAILAFVLLSVASVFFLKGPTWIPKEPPQEDRRIIHPAGFSVVCPPGWVVKIVKRDVGLNDWISLRGGPRSTRFAPELYVGTFNGPPIYLSNYQETVFLGDKAYERTDLAAGNGEYFTYELFLANRSQWYKICYQIPSSSQNPLYLKVPEKMMPYLESFGPAP